MPVYITPPAWVVDTGSCVQAGSQLASVLFKKIIFLQCFFSGSVCINRKKFLRSKVLFLILKLFPFRRSRDQANQSYNRTKAGDPPFPTFVFRFEQ